MSQIHDLRLVDIYYWYFARQAINRDNVYFCPEGYVNNINHFAPKAY